MDPTMGHAVTGQATFGGEEEVHQPGMSADLSVSDMQADQAGGTEASGVVEEGPSEVIEVAALAIPPAPPAPTVPRYPAGIVDFNKPFEVFNDSDDSDIVTDLKILSVLAGNSYPVVIIGRHGHEQVVLQFDTDGDEQNGEFKAENLDAGPRTVYIRLFREGREIRADEETYDSADDAEGAYDHGNEVIGAFPIVLPPREGASQSDFLDVTGGDDFDSGVEEDEEHNDIEGTTEPQLVATNPDARYVNGRLYAPGDSVRAYRNSFGDRVGKVVKTRDHSYQTLFVQFEDGTNPYWALNKNIRTY
jgi:hypothetical protein